MASPSFNRFAVCFAFLGFNQDALASVKPATFCLLLACPKKRQVAA